MKSLFALIFPGGQLQNSFTSCRSKADALDLKYAVMPRNIPPLPSYCRLKRWPGPRLGSRSTRFSDLPKCTGLILQS
jgi:hypothetical protein